jgi:hypothetical protein
MPSNFGDFQIGVYLDAVKGVNRDTRSTFSPSNARRQAASRPWICTSDSETSLGRQPRVDDGKLLDT